MSMDNEDIVIELLKKYKDPDDFINFLKDNVLEEISNKEKRTFLYSLGVYTHKNYYYAHAIKVLELSLPFLNEIGKIDCFKLLGLSHYRISSYKKSLLYYNKGLKISLQIKDKKREADCYINLGLVYHDLANYKEALFYYEQSLNIAKEIGDRFGESACYINIGNAYQALSNYQTAISFYEQALPIKKEIGDFHN